MIHPSDIKYTINLEDAGVNQDITVYDYITIYIYDSNKQLISKYSLTVQAGYDDVTIEGTEDITFYLNREDYSCNTSKKLTGEIILGIDAAEFLNNMQVQTYSFDVDTLRGLRKETLADGVGY